MSCTLSPIKKQPIKIASSTVETAMTFHPATVPYHALVLLILLCVAGRCFGTDSRDVFLFAKRNIMFDIFATGGTNTTLRMNMATRDIASVFSMKSFQYIGLSNSSTLKLTTLLIRGETTWNCPRDDLGICGGILAGIASTAYTSQLKITLFHLLQTENQIQSVFPNNMTIVGGIKYGVPHPNESFTFLQNNIQSFSLNANVDYLFSRRALPLLIYGNSKVEYLHISSFLITTLLYSVTIFLSIVFSNVQPLKSRGIVPVAMCMFLLADLVIGMLQTWVFDIEFWLKASCWWYIPLGNNLISTIVLIYLFSLLRFVTLTHLNLRKEIFYKRHNLSISSTIPWRFRFLKWFGTRWSQVIQVLLFYFLLVAMNALFLAPDCTNIDAKSALNIVLYISLVSLLIVVEFYDFILIIASIRSDCSLSALWKIFYSQDRFYFRREFIFGFILVGIPAASLEITSLILDISPRIPPTFLARWVISINSILCWSFWWFGSGFVLSITIMKWIVRKCKNKPPAHEKSGLFRMLGDPILVDLFEEFATSEFSAENLYCYNDLIIFQNTPTVQKGYDIYNKYLQRSSSELEINVPVSYCHEAKLKLDSSTDGVVNTISGELFDPIFVVVCDNLSDTFSRFRNTNTYLKYTKMVQSVEYSLENQ